jgi:shikimate kinase
LQAQGNLGFLFAMTIRRVFLVGFMGAGKSTVGPLLASKLGWTFLDLDHEIEKKHGMPIRKIFEERGESGFRALEYAALQALVSNLNCVVALGGGAFVQQKNRELIQQLGFSVFLDCPLEVLLHRCPVDGSRPLLLDRQSVESLYHERLPYYLDSDFRVDVSTLSPNEVCDIVFPQVSG